MHLGYNRWINFENSDMKDAMLNNWNAEVGAGMVFGKKIKPFVEWRYNARHQEGTLHVGLLFDKSSFKGKKEKSAVEKDLEEHLEKCLQKILVLTDKLNDL